MKTKRFAVQGSRTERWWVYSTLTNRQVGPKHLRKQDAQAFANRLNAKIR